MQTMYLNTRNIPELDTFGFLFKTSYFFLKVVIHNKVAAAQLSEIYEQLCINLKASQKTPTRI